MPVLLHRQSRRRRSLHRDSREFRHRQYQMVQPVLRLLQVRQECHHRQNPCQENQGHRHHLYHLNLLRYRVCRRYQHQVPENQEHHRRRYRYCLRLHRRYHHRLHPDPDSRVHHHRQCRVLALWRQ